MRHRPKTILALCIVSTTMFVGCRFGKQSAGIGSIDPSFQNSLAKTILRSRQPSEAELCIKTADMVANDGHVREAILLYEKAERSEPQGNQLDAKLAPLYAQAGRFEEAIGRYQKLMNEQPQREGLLNDFAWTLVEAKQPAEAIKLIDQHATAEPADTRVKSTLAIAHFRSGSPQRAFEIFREDYGEAAAHHNLALLSIEAGDEATAQHHASLAKSLGQDHPQITELHTALQSTERR